MGAHRILASLTPENTASVRLCLRLGMREEAHFVEDMFIKDRWEDTGVYAILDREWSARHG
jgi:RimJ/RimL family protein N-acetyltransferase